MGSRPLLVSCGIGKGDANNLQSDALLYPAETVSRAAAMQQATQNPNFGAFSTDIEGDMIWFITG